MKISEYQISDALEFGAYARGKKYFEEGKVLSCEIALDTAEELLLNSEVKGSGRQSYHQSITLSLAGYNNVTVRGNCSCPVAWNCKHVAAVCFQYRKNYNNDPSTVAKEWLQKVLSISEKDESLQSTDNEWFLVYRLNENNGKINLSVYKCKYLKNGKLSAGVSQSLERISYGHNTNSYNFLDAKDHEIMNMITDMIDRFSYTGLTFKGPVGYLLLRELIATKRCFYAKSTTPLVYKDDNYDLQFSWQTIDEKHVKLTSNIDESTHALVTTKPMLVIDSTDNTVLPLVTRIKPKILTDLRQAPPMPKESIGDVYQSLSVNIPSIALPTPKGFPVTTIDEDPVPYAFISKGSSVQEFHLTLEFSYGPFFVNPLPFEPIQSKFDKKGKIEIIRKAELEKQFLDKLKAFGFSISEEQHYAHCSINSGNNKQAALKKWNEFLNLHVDTLIKENWHIEFCEDFNLKFENDSEIVIESDDSNDWFSLSFDIKFGGRSLPLVPLVSTIFSEFDSIDGMPDSLLLEVADSHYVEIKTKDIKPILNTIYELFDQREEGENLKLKAFDAHMLDLDEDKVTWRGSKEILNLSKKLKDFTGIKKVKPPKCLQLSLRDYQQEGLNWLSFLHEFKFSGILADDMGLGKTVQTLAHLSRLKQLKKLNKPCLIIVPTSLIANWKNEVNKFTPNLNLLTLYGSDRFDKFETIKKHDLILTTYALVTRDEEIYKKTKLKYIILDEAQKIKNHKTKMAKTICSLKSEYRLALSGTPIENHLGELWSIFNFLMPGFLYNQSMFNTHYRNPIEKDYDNYKQQQLNKRIKPFVLRRSKNDVLAELPPKTEIIKYTQFDDKQSKLYESIRISMEKKVRDAIKDKGLNRSHIHILDALLKLRQVCCDPSLVKLDTAKKVKESAKLELFLDLVDELLQENRKILVFSQFTSMLSILEKEIKKKKISYVKLTGSSLKRDKIIDKFTQGQADIFLISLKAGGVGLNLVEADTVIHYDPWWNPAVENQATDRAHRMGQDKAVFVYKLVVENTIEQKIIELQKKKKKLQEAIYEKDGKLEDKKFSGSELMDLLRD